MLPNTARPMMPATKDWQALGAEKRAANLHKIPTPWRLPESITKGIEQSSTISVLDVPKSCGLLSQDELNITENYDATGLLEQLASGKLQSQDVTRAFCKRAAIAHQVTNCLTEIFFDHAMQRAKVLDDYFAREKRPMGPLHGLPISLKESYNVKGIPNTTGYISFLDKPPAANNGAIIEVLLNLGAVLYVKTNVPQTFMTGDSENNVFGRTLNPHRLCVTAGGSTGGEGALIALRGSILGVGTDSAGSIRIPSLCNGLSGFKPTANRIPFGGNTAPGRLGSPSPIFPVTGPLGTSIRDLELFMKVVIDSDPWVFDEGVIAVPWRSVPRPPPTTRLRIGLITEDPSLPLHPPTLRALRTAVQKLENNGHTVVPLDSSIPSLWSSAVLAWRFFLLDPSKAVLRNIQAGNEPVIKSVQLTRFSENDGWEPTMDNLFDLTVQRRGIMRIYHDLLIQNSLDVVLMPPNQCPAPPHDTYGVTPYTVLANFLDWPAAVVPFGKADKEKDALFLRKEIKYVPEYDADLAEGLPCSLQLMGRPMKDEELVRHLEIVAKVLEED
ncbi:amidase signature domain-containing protein [Phyllosticta citribraziliensis]|uniref:Amidase signature domain-containing protein n=1 Tax=Phyllosticta citribraziliensis TaxID=989973 RepID=A0ABR1LE11_9PEZI